VRFAIDTPNFGDYSDPRLMAEMARETEEAGWDGFFIWDHMLWTSPDNFPVADPYVTLAAMAASTSRITLGPMITPVARRRPWKLAREAVTLDHLSGGRFVLGVGIGGDWFGDYSRFGEPPDDKSHAEMLDEGLDVLAGLWSGEPFSYEGKHYKINDAQFLPRPVQQPRIPIWVAGRWPNKKPFQRAARWDGVYPLSPEDETRLSPDDFRSMIAYINEQRESNEPFEVLHAGRTDGDDIAKDRDLVQPYAEAGVTWWVEDFNWEDSPALVRERIRKGPPEL
jgi:alkanesulfonate monooxygenase SsuD/methylene tetrahydromethanopterin reductase-like flavin-dependent oxidoreductase (luciferase family)